MIEGFHWYRDYPIVRRILSIISSSKVHTRNERQNENARDTDPKPF